MSSGKVTYSEQEIEFTEILYRRGIGSKKRSYLSIPKRVQGKDTVIFVMKGEEKKEEVKES